MRFKARWGSRMALWGLWAQVHVGEAGQERVAVGRGGLALLSILRAQAYCNPPTLVLPCALSGTLRLFFTSFTLK